MEILIGTTSYATAAVAFLFLFLLLVMSWRGRLQGILLAASSLVTAIWAGAEAYLASHPDGSRLFSNVFEVLRSAIWFVFLFVLLGYTRKNVRTLGWVVAGLATLCGGVLATSLYPESISSARHTDMFNILGPVLLAVVGMVFVEQLFRNVHPQQRWGIKFLCLGLGGMFAYDFYLYSDALLFRRVDPNIWAARGAVNALVVPLLAIATARNPKWSVNVSVSRHILFHSAAVFGAAAYLLIMAAAGYYIRYFGGNWGTVLQVTFLFCALLLLFLVLFSGTLRARLKVFLSKSFFKYHYDYREEWLNFTRTLSEGGSGQQLRECSIQAIANLVDSPGGALWLAQDSGNVERVAHWNMPSAKGTEQPDGSLCQFLETRQWVVNLNEYAARPELYESLALPDWLRSIPRAWLVVPLNSQEELLGFVVLAQSRGNINLNWEVCDILKTAGRQAASYLAQLETAKALLVARQFESFNRMSAFVVHDLKNLVSQLSLLLSNADKHKRKAAFQDDMIETVANSVDKMKRLLFQLRGGYTLEPPAAVALNEVLQQVVAARAGLRPAPVLETACHFMSVLGHRVRLERVIGHLVQNAIEATSPEGSVAVRLVTQKSFAVISIADTGCGMTEQFIRDRLFKPFESTKTTGMGVGTYEAQQYVREIGGDVEVESREKEGTLFRVKLPLYMPEQSTDEDIPMERAG